MTKMFERWTKGDKRGKSNLSPGNTQKSQWAIPTTEKP